MLEDQDPPAMHERPASGATQDPSEHHPATATTFVVLVLTTLLAPGTLRLLQSVESSVAPARGDLRGVFADFAVSMLLSALFATFFLARARLFWIARLGAGALMISWVIANNANLEHVATLGTLLSSANAGYLFDGTFVVGSAIHFSHPIIFATLVGASCAGLFLVSRSHFNARKTLSFAFAAGITIVLCGLLPADHQSANWRQTNFVLENVRWIATSTTQSTNDRPIHGLFPADLDGAPKLALDHNGSNVLMVVLEGISGAYLDRIAQLHGSRLDRPRLETLDRLAREGYTLVNFVNQQRQTNRGLYSLVCGDLPKQTTAAPKMSEIGLEQQDAICLPRALARNGYETAFLQAAPLGFMGKDKFMPRAGFSNTYGSRYFAGEKGTWGVDDRDFLHQSMDLIHELQDSPKPWFLTLLTSGTHHPFAVPDDFEGVGDDRSFARAVDYLDLALAEFMQAIDASNVRDDTIIIFTSDESFGLGGTDGDLNNEELMLSQAWGVMVALLPSGERAEIQTPFSQTDVAVSILDLLGLEHEAMAFRGRSFFRDYKTSRPIPFANTYMRMSAMVEDEKHLLICQEDWSHCRRLELSKPPLIFAGNRDVAFDESSAEDHARKSLLADISERSLELGPLPRLARREKTVRWQLIDTPITAVIDAAQIRAGIEKASVHWGKDWRESNPDLNFVPLFGNQYISLPARQQVRIVLEAEVLGTHAIEVLHTLTAVPKDAMPSTEDYRRGAAINAERQGRGSNTFGLRPRFTDRKQDLGWTRRTLQPNDLFRLSYSYSSDTDYERLNARLLARTLEEGIAGLVIRRATLELRPLPADKEPEGLVIHEYSHPLATQGVLAAGP